MSRFNHGESSPDPREPSEELNAVWARAAQLNRTLTISNTAMLMVSSGTAGWAMERGYPPITTVSVIAIGAVLLKNINGVLKAARANQVTGAQLHREGYAPEEFTEIIHRRRMEQQNPTEGLE